MKEDKNLTSVGRQSPQCSRDGIRVWSEFDGPHISLPVRMRASPSLLKTKYRPRKLRLTRQALASVRKPTLRVLDTYPSKSLSFHPSSSSTLPPRPTKHMSTRSDIRLQVQLLPAPIASQSGISHSLSPFPFNSKQKLTEGQRAITDAGCHN